jgi:hypothetical protein
LPFLLRGQTLPSRPVTGVQPGQEAPDAANCVRGREPADLRALRVEYSRDFGECYLAVSRWHRFGLDSLLAGLLPAGRESVGRAHTAALLTGYLVGTPKSWLRAHGQALPEHTDWKTVQEGLAVRLVEHSEGEPGERYVLCRSGARAGKERAMLQRQSERVQAHILVCFLALALWRTLEQWMRSKGLGTCARLLVKQMAGIKRVDLIVPVRRSAIVTELRLRVVTTPDPASAQLLALRGRYHDLYRRVRLRRPRRRGDRETG